MDLQNFSSIFEIFATFTLAYIIIDELTENPFISLITEKILKKYQDVEKHFDVVKNKIAGHKTSLNNIPQMVMGDIEPVQPEAVGADEAIQQKVLGEKEKIMWENYQTCENLLKSIEQRVNQSYIEIRTKIRLNYATKVFVYLNSYLFLYCLTALIIGGLYHEEVEYIGHNLRLDYSLFFFCSLSLLVLIVGWFFDKHPNKEKVDDDDQPARPINGYLVVAVVFVIVIILSTSAYFFRWNLIFFSPEYSHNILTLCCIALPILNFVVYMFKARKRANKILPHLIERAKAFKKDYNKELEVIDNYLAMCNFLKPGDIIKVPT